ncbi:MAG: glycosyltransferase family 9 protein [Planctomycetota bacterium]
MAAEPTDPERILLVRPSALGDVCRTVPVLAALRRRWPDARIDWLVQDGFAQAIAAHPALTEAVPFPRRRLSPIGRPDRMAAAARWALGLRRRRYDLVLDCQGLLRSGLITWATGAPRRVGDAAAREGAARCYTERVDVPADAHTVDRMMALAEAAGAHDASADPDMRLHLAESDAAWAERTLAGVGPLVVLAPTARWMAKRWPQDRFADLAERLMRRTDATIAVVGGVDEGEQCPALLALARRERRVLDLVGGTTIGRLMAVVARGDLVIANDSAALHMAVGFDRPLVALFGPTLTHLVGPYGREADVLQHATPGHTAAHKDPANAAMMRTISVDEVEAAALGRLSRTAARSPS